MPDCNKRSYVLIQIRSFKLRDCLSTCDLLLPPDIKRLTIFGKSLILEPWQGSEYVFDKIFARLYRLSKWPLDKNAFHWYKTIYMLADSHLGQIICGKRVGAQNSKRPNRDIKFSKSRNMFNMFKANEVERKIEINLLIDMQINLSSFRTSDHFFLAVPPAIVMRLTW